MKFWQLPLPFSYIWTCNILAFHWVKSTYLYINVNRTINTRVIRNHFYHLKKSSQLNRIDQKPSCLHWHVSIFNDDYFKQQFLHVKIKCTCRLKLSLDNRTYLFNIINVCNRLFLFDICSFQPKYQKLLHEHRGNAGKFYDTQYLF